jgi:hypothetical protein
MKKRIYIKVFGKKKLIRINHGYGQSGVGILPDRSNTYITRDFWMDGYSYFVEETINIGWKFAEDGNTFIPLSPLPEIDRRWLSRKFEQKVKSTLKLLKKAYTRNIKSHRQEQMKLLEEIGKVGKFINVQSPVVNQPSWNGLLKDLKTFGESFKKARIKGPIINAAGERI